MRIPKEFKDKIFQALDNRLLSRIEEVKQHRALKLGKDIDERFAWDCFWCLSVEVRESLNIYENGFNDNNLGTVLKDYVKNRPEFNI
jgi:hypothetical protein